MGKLLTVIIVATIGTSVVAASVMVAIILILFRWELVPVGGGMVRLDRWRGEVTTCQLGPSNDNKVACQ